MTTTGYFEPMIVMLAAQFAIYVGAEPAARDRGRVGGYRADAAACRATGSSADRCW